MRKGIHKKRKIDNEAEELINEFEDYLKYDLKRSDNTVSNYVIDLLVYAEYLYNKKSILDVTDDDLFKYFNYLHKKISSRNLKSNVGKK